MEIIETPVRFHLHGRTSAVLGKAYADVGLPLMHEVLKIVEQSRTATPGVNHWVYLAGGGAFEGCSGGSRKACRGSRYGAISGRVACVSALDLLLPTQTEAELTCPVAFAERMFYGSPHETFGSLQRLSS